jgi:hypothetical protein
LPRHECQNAQIGTTAREPISNSGPRIRIVWSRNTVNLLWPNPRQCVESGKPSINQVTDLGRAVGATWSGDDQIRLKIPKKISISFAIARHYRSQKARSARRV